MSQFRLPIAAALAAALGTSPALVRGDEAHRRELTPAEKAFVEKAVKANNLSTDGLAPVKRANGVALDLQGRFESVSIAVVRDGKLQIRCVQSQDEAADFLASDDVDANGLEVR